MSSNLTPFFAAPPGNPSAERLLLISYHFPPGDAVGALRWQKLSLEAARRGWALDVITVHPSSLQRTDGDRLAELPPSTRVYGVPATRLLIDDLERAVWSVVRRLKTVRRRGSAPDRGTLSKSSDEGRPHSLARADVLTRGWSRRAAIRTYYAWLYHRRNLRWAEGAHALGARLARDARPRAVISCGPPHEAHVAASTIAARFAVPHVVDMRDPWSLVERLPEIIAAPITYRAAERHEARVMRAAQLVVCNTEPAAEAMRARYPHLGDRCIAVMNGYDADPLPPAAPDRRFLIAYAGSIYLDRDPGALFRAAARVIHDQGLTPADFGIELMGHEEIAAGPGVLDLAKREGISEYVRRHAPGSRTAALEFLSRAAMLVSLPQDSDMAIPSKVFEYMRYDAWLLALADAGSATARLLTRGGADIVAPHDVVGIARVLEHRLEEFRRSGTPRTPALVPSSSRAEQARIFFAALDRVLGRPASRIGQSAT